MKCEKKTGYRAIFGLTIIIGILSVIFSLCQKYFFPESVSKEKIKTIEECHDDFNYGVINLPVTLPKPDRVLKVPLATFGTRVSGDIAPLTMNTFGYTEVLDSTIEFPV